MPARRKRSIKRASKRTGPQRKEARTDIERGFEEFGEEMGRLGERLGQCFGARGKERQRMGEGRSNWFHHTFGLAGPFISSVFGIVILSLLTMALGFVGSSVQSGLLFNVHTFILANMGIFFLIFVFFSYTSYLSKASPSSYMPFAPIFNAVGIMIGFWMAAKAISIANISLALPMLQTAQQLIELNLMSLFWLFLFIGYLVFFVRYGFCRGRCFAAPAAERPRAVTKQELRSEARSDAGVRRLYRSGKDRILGGVCGGIAEYLGVDPVIIRILWVVATLAWGFGILLYMILWIIIPRNPKHKWD